MILSGRRCSCQQTEDSTRANSSWRRCDWYKRVIRQPGWRRGIRCDMLRHWKQQVEGGELTQTEVFPGQGRVANAEQEVRRLRRELELVTQERDFLKKAAAYFAKERS